MKHRERERADENALEEDLKGREVITEPRCRTQPFEQIERHLHQINFVYLQEAIRNGALDCWHLLPEGGGGEGQWTLT